MAVEQKGDAQKSTRRSYLMCLVGDERRTSDAALGIALRGAGHNLRVHIIQFLNRAGRDRGEVTAVSFLTGVSLSQHGMVSAEQTEADFDGPPISHERLDSALREAMTHIERRVTNILILDGILTLIDQGMLDESRVVSLVEKAAPWLDIVMTGRDATETLRDAAHSVTLMQEVKSGKDQPSDLRRGIHY
jgi:cob(I)alamin adenosyltransferase